MAGRTRGCGVLSVSEAGAIRVSVWEAIDSAEDLVW